MRALFTFSGLCTYHDCTQLRREWRSVPIIVIDPGHGGRDPGAVGNGLQEKNLVLPTALKVRDALRRCGFTVIMTRETDTLPYPSGTIGQDLTYRAQLANRNNADLFISWHADSSSTSTVNGVALWIYPNAVALVPTNGLNVLSTRLRRTAVKTTVACTLVILPFCARQIWMPFWWSQVLLPTHKMHSV